MVRSEHMRYVWIQNHELQVILTCILHIEAVMVPVLAHIHKTKESVTRKLPINRLSQIERTYSLLHIVLVHLLRTCTLAKTCAFQFCLHVLAERGGICASALHIQVEYIPGEEQRGPHGKQHSVEVNVIVGVIGV